ncbi:YusW family protein [Sporosarcina sp. CAU 1771]
MKLKIIGLFALASILMISGCGNKITQDKDEPSIKHENSLVGGSSELGDGYGFDKFDLEITVDGKEMVDADYDMQSSKVKAEYENKFEGKDFKDEKAMTELDELFKTIRITKDTSKEEAMDNIVLYLGADTYTEFELKVHFDDGTVLEIDEVK